MYITKTKGRVWGSIIKLNYAQLCSIMVTVLQSHYVCGYCNIHDLMKEVTQLVSL